MIDELLQDAREHMDKSCEATRSKFGSVRTGRATPHLLDRISVDYYGTKTPLKQLATGKLATVQQRLAQTKEAAGAVGADVTAASTADAKPGTH